jgi:hypothetical protein
MVARILCCTAIWALLDGAAVEARPLHPPLSLTLHDGFLPGPNRTTSAPPAEETPNLYKSILAIDVHKLRVDGGFNVGRVRLDGALLVENDFPAVSAKISLHSGLKSISLPIPLVQFMPDRVGTANGWIVQMRLFQRDF